MKMFGFLTRILVKADVVEHIRGEYDGSRVCGDSRPGPYAMEPAAELEMSLHRGVDDEFIGKGGQNGENLDVFDPVRLGMKLSHKTLGLGDIGANYLHVALNHLKGLIDRNHFLLVLRH